MQKVIKLPPEIASSLIGKKLVITHIQGLMFEVVKAATRNQQNKYYATLRRISSKTGHSVAELHEEFKREFVGETTQFLSDDEFSELITIAETRSE